MPDPEKPRRPQRKPSDWSPRPIPQPAPERRTADPVTPKLKELAARRDVVQITPVAHSAPPPPAPKVAEPQTLEAKKERLAQRRALVQRSRDRAGRLPPGPERNALLGAASRFEDDTRAVDRARLAQHVYQYYDPKNEGRRPTAPIGYEQVTSPKDLARYGLTTKDLAPEKSEFRAALYRSQLDPAGKPIVVFRGTIPSQWPDWENNLQQGIGWESDYYKRALSVGSRLAASHPGGFESVGHSLGGGMASAVSAAYKVPGDTFNAAGVSEWTLSRVGATRADAANLVKAYRVDGEALTSIQNDNRQSGRLPFGLGKGVRDWVDDRVLPTAIGRVRTLRAADHPTWLQSLNPLRPVNLHGADSVVDSFEQEKGQDSGLLKRETSGPGLFSR